MAVRTIRSYVPFVMLFSVLILLPALTGCAGSKSAYDSRLSDLGGVYSCKESDLDLTIEVSGRLTEGSVSVPAAGSAAITEEGGTEGVYSNKLLRWGISRRENNQTPAADPGAPQLLSKYGGAYIGDTSKKTVYLTFDEGYENGYTPLILDTLKSHGIRAVFFITGPYLNVHQDLVRRMVDENQIVGNHTIHHPSLPEISDDQVEEEVLGLDRAFFEKFDQHMQFLRPPKGEYSERTLALTRKLGYCNLFWSFAYDDWYRDRIRGPEYAYNIVMRNLHNGAVLLLHAVSKDNAEALDMIIKGIGEKGYKIGDPMDILQQGAVEGK